MNPPDTVLILRDRAEKGMDDKKCSEALVNLVLSLVESKFIMVGQNLGPVVGGKGYVSLAWIDENTVVEVAIKRRK